MTNDEKLINLTKRIEAIEEVLNLNKKTWKELNWSCPGHPIPISWCKDCIYNNIVKGKLK